jgi:5-methylthioadenosine/S-adenosylhomocysteine deaminase
MRAGSYTQSGRRTMLGDAEEPLKPFDWLRLGSLEGARVLGLDRAIGSIEEGKEADFVCVDASVTAPVAGDERDEPDEIAGRLIYRARPSMIRGAWVRGRRLPA